MESNRPHHRIGTVTGRRLYFASVFSYPAVSFLLALTTAVRAYDLPAHETLRLRGGVGRRFLRTPLEFLVPPPAKRLYREPAVR